MATVEQALKEAYASAPQDIIVLNSLEIYHDIFCNDPIRIIRWPYLGQSFTTFSCKLESTAVRDAGKTVTFVGVPFTLKVPDQSTETIGSFEIKMDGFNSHLYEVMEQVCLDGRPMSGIYRIFIKGRESEGPASVWNGLELENPRMEGLSFVISAAVLRWTVAPYGRNYTAVDYPALVTSR